MTLHPSFCLICKKKLSEHTDKELVDCSFKIVKGGCVGV